LNKAFASDTNLIIKEVLDDSDSGASAVSVNMDTHFTSVQNKINELNDVI